MKEKYKGLTVGISFFLISIFYIIGAVNIKTFTPFGHTGLTSRSIPQTLGFLMAVLSLSKIISEVKVLSCLVDQKDEEQTVTEYINIFNHKMNKSNFALILTVVLIVLYVSFYRSLGFIISSILFLIALTLFLCPQEKRSKKLRTSIVIFSILFSLFIYYIFTTYFSMVLPQGLLG